MLIVLTSDQTVEHEIHLIHQLFQEGLEILHIRKPDYLEEDLRQFIQKIDSKCHSKLVIHKHHKLCFEFNLRGIHLKEQDRIDFGENSIEYLNTFSSKGYTTSTSFHDLETLKMYAPYYNYCFLSPVFSSISKQGYKGKRFNVTRTSKEIIALGGVQKETIKTVFELGYKGIGILGAIWKSKIPVESFKEIKKVFDNIEN